MRRVRSRDTKPEMAVRRMAWALGARYRLHARDLPGTPDIVLRSRRKAIFVHGCFFHLHRCTVRANIPQSRVDYWRPKLLRNRERDRASIAKLRRAGWSVLVVWECELREPERVRSRLRKFLREAR